MGEHPLLYSDDRAPELEWCGNVGEGDDSYLVHSAESKVSSRKGTPAAMWYTIVSGNPGMGTKSLQLYFQLSGTVAGSRHEDKTSMSHTLH